MSDHMQNFRSSLEERLRKELRKGRPMHSAPAGFTERVMANLPTQARSGSGETPEGAASPWPRWALGIGFGFALMAIAAVFAFEFLGGAQVDPLVASHSSNSVDGSNVSIAEVESSPAEAFTLMVPGITSEQLQALTTRLDQPLERELENVISDTRQAIQFVASNFLPEK